MAFRSTWRSFIQRYEKFLSGQGMTLLTLTCVGVIVGSAVWARQTPPELPAPTPPVSNAASVAELWQQSLRDVSTPTPEPTQAPLVWHSPLERIVTLRSFDGARMIQSAVTGVWQLHDAVDLAAVHGEIVRSMADGVVLLTEEEGLWGVSVTVDHSGGYQAQYSGFSFLGSIREGDPVKAGQTLGFAGNSILSESDMEPHLHLRITRDGKAIDPLLLLRSVSTPSTQSNRR